MVSLLSVRSAICFFFLASRARRPQLYCLFLPICLSRPFLLAKTSPQLSHCLFFESIEKNYCMYSSYIPLNLNSPFQNCQILASTNFERQNVIFCHFYTFQKCLNLSFEKDNFDLGHFEFKSPI